MIKTTWSKSTEDNCWILSCGDEYRGRVVFLPKYKMYLCLDRNDEALTILSPTLEGACKHVELMHDLYR